MSGWSGEGSIDIDLVLAAGKIAGVRIVNRRVLGGAAVVVGRRAEEGPGLISRLFSVCRMAQGVASVRAVEQAGRAPAAAGQEAARRMLLLGEMVLEHGSRAAFDWPILLGEPPAIGAVKALRGALTDLHRVIYPEGDWLRPGGGRLAPDLAGLTERLAAVAEALGLWVFGGEPDFDGREWKRWAGRGRTAAARLLARLAAEELEGYGASEVTPLPELSEEALGARMAADRSGSFLASPDWGGLVHQTGPLARQSTRPAVAAIIAEYGPGVLAHLTARLVELAACLREMRDSCGSLCDHDGAPAAAAAAADGCGLAAIEAARGRLVHRVELREGTVAQYQILAPTEWNFRSDGALARGLAGQPGGDDPAWRARLLVTALDPCVAYSLRVA